MYDKETDIIVEGGWMEIPRGKLKFAMEAAGFSGWEDTRELQPMMMKELGFYFLEYPDGALEVLQPYGYRSGKEKLLVFMGNIREYVLAGSHIEFLELDQFRHFSYYFHFDGMFEMFHGKVVYPGRPLTWGEARRLANNPIRIPI